MGSSDGRGADLGVLSIGSSGFGERGVLMVGIDDTEGFEVGEAEEDMFA